MDLYGAGGYYRFGTNAWCWALELAERYGWSPAGTEAPEGTNDWDDQPPKGYTLNAGQLVTAEDASAMAEALERALPQISDEGDNFFSITPGEYQYAHLTGDLPAYLTGDVLRERMRRIIGAQLANEGEDEPETPEEYWAGNKLWLEEFVKFCRVGEFRIY